MLIEFLSSLRLTLALLLGLSVVAMLGTIEPMAEGRYDLFYQSLWFRLGLTLLFVNLAVCTGKTALRNLRDRQRLFEGLKGEQLFARPLRYVLPRDRSLEELGAGLRRAGYRVEQDGEELLARRGLAGRWGSTVVHLSVLAIMLGALTAELGFVGTLNIYVGDKSAVYFDWDRQQDLPLGFEFRLDHFEPIYYPIELRFAEVDPVSRQPLHSYTSREGETVALSRPGLVARVLKFIPDAEHLILGLEQDGRYLGEYHAFGGGRSFDNRVAPGLEVRPLAWRDPVLQQLHSEVSILEGGKVVRQGVIEVNQPLVHRGVAIYQTAYNRDKFGFWFAGFQFTRDPGEPLVWVACITVVLGLLLSFLVPFRAVGISRRSDEVLLVALAGFRGDAGSELFDRLEQALQPYSGEAKG